MEAWHLALGVVFVLLLAPAIIYNRFVRLRNHCIDAWSCIDTELKRRYDLIPNLVNVVKGYAAHEKAVLEEVTRLRQQCVADTSTPGHQASTENQLVTALRRLLAVVERYPELKASENFLKLQQELAITEDRIQAARRFYNGNVREMNNAVQSFPFNFFAKAFGFGAAEFFEIEDVRARQAPEVNI